MANHRTLPRYGQKLKSQVRQNISKNVHHWKLSDSTSRSINVGWRVLKRACYYPVNWRAFSRQPRQIRTRWEGVFPPGCPEARMTFVIWTFHILFPIIHHFIPTKDPHYSGKKSQKSSHGQNERGWECIWKSNWIHFVLLLPPGTSAGFRHWGWGVSKHLQPHRVRGGGVWQPEVQFDIERVSSTDMNSPSSGGQEVTPSRALFHLYPICTFELTSKWIDV